MSYSNRFSGAITIKPPLIRSEIDAAPDTRDAVLGIVTQLAETPEGYTATVIADAIIGPDEPCSGYGVEKDIQALIDAFPSHEFTGFIQADWDPGFGEPPSRFVVKDRRVRRIDAVYAWPEVD